MIGPRLVILASLALASASLRAQAPSECAAGILADSLRPSREGFFREVLFAPGSARTPRFDDYTPGSYHADKVDIAEGLPPVAKKCGLVLEGLVVIGPVGPLWAYHVIVFLREGSGIRLNTLVMPHARVTGKGTAVINPTELTEFFQVVASSTVLRPGLPVWSDTTKAGLAREFSFDFLAIRFGPTSSEVWSGSIGRNQDSTVVTSVFKALNQFLSRVQPTYGHGN